MIASNTEKLRVGFLAVVFGLVLVIVLKVIFLTSPPVKEDKFKLNSIDYPKSVALPGWQLTNSQPITVNNSDENKTKLNEGYKYEFSKDDLKLEVETYYQPYNGGNVSRLLSLYKGIRTRAVITGFDYKPDTGYYSSFVNSQRIILTACVNPNGETTVTEQQHAINRYKSGLNLGRTLSWIFGQTELVNAGCLWTYMSMPLQTKSGSLRLQEAQNLLQAAWVDWTLWWRPKLTSS